MIFSLCPFQFCISALAVPNLMFADPPKSALAQRLTPLQPRASHRSPSVYSPGTLHIEMQTPRHLSPVTWVWLEPRGAERCPPWLCAPRRSPESLRVLERTLTAVIHAVAANSVPVEITKCRESPAGGDLSLKCRGRWRRRVWWAPQDSFWESRVHVGCRTG